MNKEDIEAIIDYIDKKIAYEMSYIGTDDDGEFSRYCEPSRSAEKEMDAAKAKLEK